VTDDETLVVSHNWMWQSNVPGSLVTSCTEKKGDECLHVWAAISGVIKELQNLVRMGCSQ
jgi:hypothetical protein